MCAQNKSSFLLSARIKIVSLARVKWFRTLYFNFKVFPFKTALKLPVYFYSRVKFISLSGDVVINSPIRRAMVKIGVKIELGRVVMGISEMNIKGTMVINGAFSTGPDILIYINKDAILEIGENSYFGSRTRVMVTNKLVMGRYCRFGYESQILDSNFHYMLDIGKNEVKRLNGEIIIKDFCWIGNRSTIQKNTVIPRYTTIASNSLLNRDYSADIPERSIIGGIPAKLIKTDVIRIFDFKQESKINNYFISNPKVDVYKPENEVYF